MNEDDESAALAHQQELEARRFQEWQQALKDDAEAYHRWLMELEREFQGLGLFGPTPDECWVRETFR